MLNEIPVLDKGYVAIYSTSPTGVELQALAREFFRNAYDRRLLANCNFLVKIRCPLFVQMTFPEFGFKYIVKRGEKPEAFIPTVDQVYAQTLEASQTIQADIAQTTAALLLNPTAYQMEHCDPFVSQVISPISMYNVLIVNGSLVQWLDYLAQQGLPTPVEAYRKAIDGIFYAEYPMLKGSTQGNGQQKR